MSKKLSILIPTYNRAACIAEKIGYFEKEQINMNEVEIVISNNCSEDSTKDYLNQAAITHPDWKIYHQKKNIGGERNFRFLIGRADGEYIWLVGDDDILKPGVINKILFLLSQNRDITHIFLNYATMKNGEIQSGKRFTGKGGLFCDGQEMFFHIWDNCGYGSLMFLSANIFRKKEIEECIEVIDCENEQDNMAFTVGYSLWSGYYGKGYIVSEICLYDEYALAGWSESSIKVFCRDVIAICIKLAKYQEDGDRVDAFLLHHLPHKAPEFYYAYYGKKFGKDNFALKWLIRKHPFRIVPDFLTFFFERMCRLISKVKERIM